MAEINLTNPLFYRAGQSGVSEVVGWESKKPRTVRYEFTAPPTGASSINMLFSGCTAGNGKTPTTLRCYIGTDPYSHANPDASSPYLCKLSRSSNTYSGSADIILMPSQRYYLWVFTDDFGTWGWVYWPRSGGATLTTYGGSASVLSGANGMLGSSNRLTIKRYSSAATHNLTASCGDAAMTIATGVQSDTYIWTPPLDWAAQNTAGSAVSVTVTCSTQIDGQTVGTTSVTLSMTIPSSVVPACSLQVSDTTGLLDDLGGYVQTKSRAKVVATVSGVYGSSIVSTEISCGGSTVSANTATFDLHMSGSVNIEVTTTDSRGRQATAKTIIAVKPYSPPTAKITRVYRCSSAGVDDPSGDHACIVFDAAVDKLVTASARYAVMYCVRGSELWTTKQLPQYTATAKVEGATVVLPAPPDVACDFSVLVTDRWGSRSSAHRGVQVSFALLDIDKSCKSVAIGEVATAPDTFAVGLRAQFDSDLTFAGLAPRMHMQYGDDANKYIEPGLYSVDTDDDAKSIANLPYPYAGLMLVINATGGRNTGADPYISQIYLPLYPEYPTARRLVVDGNWTAWNSWLDLVYPIGSIYMSVNATSPDTLFGGHWERIEGKFLLGAGRGGDHGYAAGSTGGEVAHTLTAEEMPRHDGHLTANDENSGGNFVGGYLGRNVFQSYGSSGRGWNVQASTEVVPAGHSKGGSQPHNNMPPYLAVYMWQRVG